MNWTPQAQIVLELERGFSNQSLIGVLTNHVGVVQYVISKYVFKESTTCVPGLCHRKMCLKCALQILLLAWHRLENIFCKSSRIQIYSQCHTQRRKRKKGKNIFVVHSCFWQPVCSQIMSDILDHVDQSRLKVVNIFRIIIVFFSQSYTWRIHHRKPLTNSMYLGEGVSSKLLKRRIVEGGQLHQLNYAKWSSSLMWHFWPKGVFARSLVI